MIQKHMLNLMYHLNLISKSKYLKKTKKLTSDYVLLKKSKLLNSKWYLNSYPDVKAAKCDPILHYLNHGWKEGRNPSPYFNTNAYLAQHPDCKSCPLLFVHRNRFDEFKKSLVGKCAWRNRREKSGDLKTISKSIYFDAQWYFKTYPDAKESGMSALEHYMTIGWKEGRNPSSKFSTIQYLKDHQECKICPLVFEHNRNDFVDLSICAIMKNEGPYVKEWIDYYCLLGVKRFYIYDNESTDNMKEVLTPYIGQGLVVYQYFPGEAMQIPAYNEYLKKYKDKTKWVAVIDTDEFIIPKKHSSIPEFLKEYDSFAGVGINWLAFDSNGHKTKPKGGVISNYTRVHWDDEYPSNHHIKCIVQPRFVDQMKVHYHIYKKGYYAVLENKKRWDEGKTPLFHGDRICINHYYCKSEEEAQIKMNRGTVLDPKGFIKRIPQTQINFFPYRYNYDIYKYVVKLHPHLWFKETAKYIWCIIQNIFLNLKHLSKKDKLEDYIDVQWYFKTYPDAKESGMSALEHYMTIGWKKGYNPSPRFDTQFYLTRYPDISKANLIPLQHYLTNGQYEGRIPTAHSKPQKKLEIQKDISVYDLLSTSKWFDKNWYWQSYPDIASKKIDPVKHYVDYGWKEGRNPGPKFNTLFYLKKYPDVAQMGINPLQHYILYGKSAGKLPCEAQSFFWKRFHINQKPESEYLLLKKSKLFNGSYYLKHYPEVKSSNQNPITHYLTIGYKEGKNPSKYFDTTFYLATYPDIARAGINPLVHYLKYGKSEGRSIAQAPELTIKSKKKKKVSNPLISVIVASYNYENYIKKTLDSLLAQTYKNFEIIVVDDGSKDNSVKVVQKYVKKYPNVVLHRHHQGANKGLIQTILLGLTKAKGDYIAFCESDDYWVPEHLQEKVNLIHKYGAPEMIANDVELFDHPTPEYTEYLNRGLRLLPSGKSSMNILKYTFNPMATFSAVMFRADILRECNFDSIIPAWTDWWLYRQILSRYPLYFVKKRLTMWRIHDSYNTTARSNKYAEELDKFILCSNALLAQSNKKILKKMRLGRDYKIVAGSGFFDEKWYLKQYPEVKSMNIPPICHFNAIGWKLGYNPSLKFSTNGYLGLNADVAFAKVNPLIHYIKSGQKENRPYIPCHYKETIYRVNQPQKHEKRILLVTHELSRTGAPILLLFVAQLLQKKNVAVTVLSPRDGILRKDFIKSGVNVIIDAISFINQDHLKSYKKQFDFCICNTFLNAKVYSWLNQLFPSILWIHDNLNEQSANLIMPVLSTSKDIYVPSERTKSCLEQYNNDIKMLSYPVKDIASKFRKKAHIKLKIAVCAALQPRKGQDIFIRAVKALPKKIRSEAEFFILGKEVYPDYIKTLQNLAKGVPEIQFLPTTDNFEDYHKFVSDLDILVCPSREDPYPLVVIDAFMHSVPVIISDHVGQKQLLNNGKNGFIFESENVSELTSILAKLIQEKISDTLRAASRQVFEQNFSDKQFLDALKQIMENTTCKK